jgi:phage FluMu protein Com
MSCQKCGKRFRFPIRPGKLLNITCPHCKSVYQISFINPLKGLITGQLRWSNLSRYDQIMLIGLGIVIALLIGTAISRLVTIDSSTNTPAIPYVI